MKKLMFKIYLSLFKKRDSVIYCHPSGDFYGIYYSDLKKWVIKDGDYCEIIPPIK